MEPSHATWPLSGRPLRYVLTVILLERGPCTVADLVAAVEQEGFVLAGRPSKSISDALRWEIEHGRVVRLRRAAYGPGTMPRQTRSRITNRVALLRARGRVGPDGAPAQVSFSPTSERQSGAAGELSL